MSDTYTKLFSSITESTVWGESYATRIVWVTMLAMADAQGNVYGAIPGLARRANVTLQETEAALDSFLAPDPYSRTRDEDGRRIEVIDGGWVLINHAKYGAIRDEAERAEYKREWDRKNRPSGHARQSDSPTVRQKSDSSPTKPDSPTPLTPTPSLTPKQKQEQASPSGSRLAADWSLPAEWRAWAEQERPGLDITLEAAKFADFWHAKAGKDGRKADWLATFRNWIRNAYTTGSPRAGPTNSPRSKTFDAMATLQGMRTDGNRLDSRRDIERPDPTVVAVIGAPAGR